MIVTASHWASYWPRRNWFTSIKANKIVHYI